MAFDDPLALACDDPLVGRDILEALRATPWPAYLYVHLADWAQAKVHAKVALGDPISNNTDPSELRAMVISGL
jgi:hypothetical protein